MAKNKKSMTEYSFEDVQKALEAQPDSLREVGESMGRTKDAMSTLRWQARQFQKGELKYVSQPLQEHFRKYFTRDEVVIEPKEEPKTPEVTEAASSDLCEHTLEGLVKDAEDTFARLQQITSQIAKVSAQHENHSLVEKMKKDMEAHDKQVEQKMLEVENELEELREFRERARKSNIGSMLRSAVPFSRTKVPATS